ncbi:uncharacterized protein LOC126833404 isoform X2 [Adelges cooleyi]|uniref:uncharacterized protein LOC126833404 isoform X2 n=1 Tax=Adelges cooleyi TaxID=133065 RepID=UPI0021808586|nr:uncharacterized protein LOC126833404 isoform X2 [Adelges cooleyi]
MYLLIQYFVLLTTASFGLTNNIIILTDWQKTTLQCTQNYLEATQTFSIQHHDRSNVTLIGLDEFGSGIRELTLRNLQEITPQMASRPTTMPQQKKGDEQYYWKLLRKISFSRNGRFLLFANRGEFGDENFAEGYRKIDIVWCKNGICEDCRMAYEPVAMAIVNQAPQRKSGEVDEIPSKIKASDKFWSDGGLDNSREFLLQLAPNSVLMGMPGEIVKLYFRVINRQWFPLELVFDCSDQHGLVRSILPTRIVLPPNGPPFDVTVIIEVGGSEGTTDQITFSVIQPQLEFIKVNFYVGQLSGDTSRPAIDYTFNGDCRFADTPHTCGSEKWNIEATIRDENSGLAAIHSIPNRLQFRNEFIIGTRDKVIVYYSATCCFPKVEIIATDLRGNIRRKTIDAEKQYLNLAEIIALVLAVLLIILFLILLVWAILRCRRRRKTQNFISN